MPSYDSQNRSVEKIYITIVAKFWANFQDLPKLVLISNQWFMKKNARKGPLSIKCLFSKKCPTLFNVGHFLFCNLNELKLILRLKLFFFRLKIIQRANCFAQQNFRIAVGNVIFYLANHFVTHAGVEALGIFIEI